MHAGLQATFLRGSSSAGADSEGELAAELEALPADDLEIRCRRNGLSRRWVSLCPRTCLCR